MKKLMKKQPIRAKGKTEAKRCLFFKCEVDFFPNRDDKVFCSTRCRIKHNRQAKKKVKPLREYIKKNSIYIKI